MRRRMRRCLGVAFLGLLLLPGAAAQDAGAPDSVASSIPTTLYFHVINVQDFPINTQEPDPAYASDGVYGPVTNTLTCLDGTTGSVTQGSTEQAFSTWYGYSSPSIVEYGVKTASGDPRTHPERGLAADVALDGAVPVVLAWYLSVDASESDAETSSAAPTPLPNVVVRATVRGGTAISVDDAAYDAGQLLLHGATPPVTLVADRIVPGDMGSAGVSAVGIVGGRWVYEFLVPLTLDATVLPRGEGFNVRMDAYMDTPACDPDEGMLQPSVGTHTSAGHRPRMELAILDPFTLAYAEPQWVDDDLVVHVGANSVWGSYDLDVEGIRVEVFGPGQADFQRAQLVQRFHEHGHHYATEDLALTWVWANATKAALPGHYDVVITVPNRQHTAELEARIAFDVAPPQEMPGPTPALLLATLLALALLARLRP